MSNAKQNYADAKAELTERQATVESKRQRKPALEQQISKLIAEQELDQVDHSARLPKLREELAEINQALAIWPDVEAEIQRRLDVAQSDLRQLEYQKKLDELKALQASELTQRQLFAEMAIQFLDSAATLNGTLARKNHIRQEILDSGRGGIDVGNLEPPVFNIGWVRNSAQGLAEAKRIYGVSNKPNRK